MPSGFAPAVVIWLPEVLRGLPRANLPTVILSASGPRVCFASSPLRQQRSPKGADGRCRPPDCCERCMVNFAGHRDCDHRPGSRRPSASRIDGPRMSLRDMDRKEIELLLTSVDASAARLIDPYARARPRRGFTRQDITTKVDENIVLYTGSRLRTQRRRFASEVC